MLKIFKSLDEGGLATLWRGIIAELLNMSTQIKTWANGRFVQSVNGKAGSSVTLTKDDMGLGNVDNTADADKRVAHASTAGDADTLDGKHASDFMLKSGHEEFELVIAQSLTDLDARKVDKEDGKGLSSNDYTTEEKTKLAGIEAGAQKHIAPTSEEIKNALGFTPADTSQLVDYSVTVDEVSGAGEYLKSYEVKQQGAVVGKIHIPKDLVVSSGSVVVGTWTGNSFVENASGTGKAVKLVIANQETPIYINVQDLVDVYTAQQGATEIQLAISATNEISATLTASVRNKINNAIPKVEGASGKVAKFNEDGTLSSTGFEIGVSVPSNAVFTDYQATKAGHYTPAEDTASKLTASASGGAEAWSMDVVKAITLKRDSKGHVVGVEVVSGKVPENPNTDYQTTKAGHYTPANEKSLQVDSSYIRDTNRDIAFIGLIYMDEKGHVVSGDTYAVQAFTDDEINNIIAATTAQIAAEMAS